MDKTLILFTNLNIANCVYIHVCLHKGPFTVNVIGSCASQVKKIQKNKIMQLKKKVHYLDTMRVPLH